MKRLIFIPLIVFFVPLSAQQLTMEDASDPVNMQTRFAVDLESYLFHSNAQFYAVRAGYHYGLKNERHLLGMSLPFVHTIFQDDYSGFENTTGVGDLKMSYIFVPFLESRPIGTERVSITFDVTAPTGESELGRGAGVWVYKPGLVLKSRLSQAVICYPEVRYQFSGNNANSAGGSDGVPDPEDPEVDDKVQNLSMSLPAVIQVEKWNGWFALNAIYMRSFTEQTNFFFVRTDFGKIIGRKSSACLRIAKFIGGQPRLNVVVQANMTFFVN